MNVHLLSAPPGLAAAFDVMNGADQAALEALVKQSRLGQETHLRCTSMRYNEPCSHPLFAPAQVTEVFELERQDSGRLGLVIHALPGVPPATQAGVNNALGYLHRGCVDHKIDGANLSAALGLATEASAETAALLAKCWDISAAAAAAGSEGGGVASAKRALSVGKLVGLDWKLGVSLASSECASLLAPFVALSFEVADANGKASHLRVELTYAEFQVGLWGRGLPHRHTGGHHGVFDSSLHVLARPKMQRRPPFAVRTALTRPAPFLLLLVLRLRCVSSRA